MAQSFKQCRIRGKISASTTTWPHLTTRCGSVWSWALNQIKPWEFGIVIIWLMIIWWILMVIIWLMMANNNLVGGWPTPLKNDGVSESQLAWLFQSEWKSVGMIIPFPTEWKVIVHSCSKPPTSDVQDCTWEHYLSCFREDFSVTMGKIQWETSSTWWSWERNLPSGYVKIAIENDHL